MPQKHENNAIEAKMPPSIFYKHRHPPHLSPLWELCARCQELIAWLTESELSPKKWPITIKNQKPV